MFLQSYTGSEEGDASPTSVISHIFGHICCIYNAAFNGHLDNDSCKGTNGQNIQ